MITCTRKLEFDAGHRVMNHESKCRNPHGHRYVVEVTATAKELDELGRVIDFSAIKSLLGTWLDTNWDHTFIVNNKDTNMIDALNLVDKEKPFYLFNGNPTAENMADYLLNIVCPPLFALTSIEIIKIKLWETPNCYAEATL